MGGCWLWIVDGATGLGKACLKSPGFKESMRWEMVHLWRRGPMVCLIGGIVIFMFSNQVLGSCRLRRSYFIFMYTCPAIVTNRTCWASNTGRYRYPPCDRCQPAILSLDACPEAGPFPLARPVLEVRAVVLPICPLPASV